MARPGGTQRACAQRTVTTLGGTGHRGQLWAWLCPHPGTHKLVSDGPDPGLFKHTLKKGPYWGEASLGFDLLRGAHTQPLRRVQRVTQHPHPTQGPPQVSHPPSPSRASGLVPAAWASRSRRTPIPGQRGKGLPGFPGPARRSPAARAPGPAPGEARRRRWGGKDAPAGVKRGLHAPQCRGGASPSRPVPSRPAPSRRAEWAPRGVAEAWLGAGPGAWPGPGRPSPARQRRKSATTPHGRGGEEGPRPGTGG